MLKMPDLISHDQKLISITLEYKEHKIKFYDSYIILKASLTNRVIQITIGPFLDNNLNYEGPI